MNQILSNSEAAFQNYLTTAERFNDMLNRSQCGTIYYVPVFSDQKIKNGYNRVKELAKEFELKLAQTKGEGKEEEHVAFQVFVEGATAEIQHYTRMVQLIHTHTDEMEEIKLRHENMTKKWSMFWGFIVSCGIILFAFLYLR